LALPIPLLGDGDCGIRWTRGSMDRLKGVLGGGEGMRGDMSRRHGLPRGTGRGVRGERRPAYDGHFEIPRLYPGLQRFDGLARALVFGVFFLEIGRTRSAQSMAQRAKAL
jgi:hypothetical protein